MNHTITVTEEQRQVLLLALAHLSLERSGWDFMLNEIASLMDNVEPGAERAKLYDELRLMHQTNAAAFWERLARRPPV